MRTRLSLFFCVFIFQICLSQNILKGHISDATGEPLEGAAVYSFELNKGVLTDAKGGFILKAFGKGSFKVRITHLGFGPVIREVIFSENDEIQVIDLSLPEQRQFMDEVFVSTAYNESARENPFSVAVVKIGEMTKNGAFTVMDEIGEVPGVDAVSTGPMVKRPVIRGLSGNRVLTLVNGTRYETQQWDAEHGIGVNELGIERVEVIKGPTSLIYGPEAMGGVLNFIEEKPAEVGTTSGSFSAALHSNNPGASARANVRSANEDVNWGVSALGKLFSDYFYDGYDFRVPNTRLLEYAAKAYAGVNKEWGASRISYTFNNAYYGILDGKDIVKDERGQIKNIDTLEKEKFPFEIEAPFHQVTDHRLSSKSTLLFGESKLKANLGYQNNRRKENEELKGSKKGYKYLDMELQSYTYDLKWYLPEWKNFHTIIGSQGMYRKNRNFEDAATQLIPDARLSDLGVLALSRYELPKLNITAGIRYDRRDLKTGNSPDPNFRKRDFENMSWSFGAAYQILEDLVLKASFASGYRAPNLNELYADGVKLETRRYEKGNPAFGKEYNREADLSVNYEHPDFSLNVSVFQNKIFDYIYLAPTGNNVPGDLDPENSYPEYQFRQANAKLRGGELFLDIHPRNYPWGHFEVKASGLEAKRMDNDSYLPMMPPTRLNNDLYLDLKDFKALGDISFRLGTETAFGQDQVAENEMKTPPYTLLNSSLSFNLENMDWTLSAHNLLNKKYLDHMSRFREYGIVEPGLDISLGVEISIADL